MVHLKVIKEANDPGHEGVDRLIAEIELLRAWGELIPQEPLGREFAQVLDDNFWDLLIVK